jgi:hypothetical protein
MGSTIPTLATEEYIQSEYGEGKYVVKLHDIDGSYIASKRLNIGPPPARQVLQAQADLQRPAEILGNTQLELLRAELAANRELLARLIDKVGMNHGSSVSELTEVLRIAQTMNPVKEPGAVLSQLVDVFKAGLNLGASGGAPEKSWTDTVKNVLDSIPEVISMLKPPGVPGAEPGKNLVETAPAQPAPADARLAMLRNGIAYLKSKARAGKDPGLWIDFVVDNLDEPQWADMATYLEKPFDEIAQALDPEIMLPIYRPWFEQLFRGLSHAIRERVDTGRPAGNGLDIAADGGPSEQSHT